MNLTSAKTKDYINFRPCDRVKNKAKTNPNKANPASPVASPRQVRKMAKMYVKVLTAMDYGKNPAFSRYKNKANSNPILRPCSGQAKANFSIFCR